jgi:hypothetical protein
MSLRMGEFSLERFEGLKTADAVCADDPRAAGVGRPRRAVTEGDG